MRALDGQLIPASGFTLGGYQGTGGDGMALCSCGWVGTNQLTREARREDWRRHKNETTHPADMPAWEKRNRAISAIIADIEDEQISAIITDIDDEQTEIPDIPVFMSPTEVKLYEALTLPVVKDLIARYRRQR